MDGVRLVARAFWAIGWIALVVGGLAVLVAAVGALTTLRSGAAAIGTVALSIGPLILVALGPFFFWALLAVLCELHDQNYSVLSRLQAIQRALEEQKPIAGSSMQVAPAVGTRSDGVSPEAKPTWRPQVGEQVVLAADGALAGVPRGSVARVVAATGVWVKVRTQDGQEGDVHERSLQPQA